MVARQGRRTGRRSRPARLGQICLLPVHPKLMRIQVLITDAFGGHGGIAKFNRDLLTALSSHPDCSRVTAFPRLMPDNPGTLPEKLTYVTAGLGGKARYVWNALKASFGGKPDLLICGHINLLPIARL